MHPVDWALVGILMGMAAIGWALSLDSRKHLVELLAVIADDASVARLVFP